LESIVTLCIALTNENGRRRGQIPRVPAAGFVRLVPIPFPGRGDASGSAPCPRPAPPPVHRDDLLSGLRPDKALTLCEDPAPVRPPRLGVPHDTTPPP
jgi:hypothetical protein